MNAEKFAQKIAVMCGCWRDSLAAKTAKPGENNEELWLFAQEISAEIFREFHVALAELGVTEIELREQQEQLTDARQAIEAERQRYQDLFEFAPDGYLVTDGWGNIQEANCAVAMLLKLSQSSLVGKNLTSFIPKPERQAFRNQLYQLRKIGPVQEWEVRLAPHNYPPFESALRVAVVRDKERKLVSLRWLVRDISERKLMEKALRESEERFRVAARCASDLIYEWDMETGIRMWFGNVDAQLGYANGEFSRTTEAWQNSLHPDDRDRVASALEQHFQTRLPFLAEYRIQCRDGSFLYWRDRGKALWDKNNRPYKWIGVTTNITLAKRSEEALRKAEKKYHSIFENAIEGIFQTTLDGHYLTANPMLAKIYGYNSPEELIAACTDIEHQLYVSPQRRQEFQELIQNQGTISGFESQIYRRDCSIIWISENAYGLYNDSGELIGYEGTVEDITERKQAEATIHYQAFHDLLTGLPNRTLFNEKLLTSLNQTKINGEKLGILFLDLDRFKIINDTLGHAVGDQLLQQASQRLKNCLRSGDTIARWGGDEFTLLLPEIHRKEEVAKIAQRAVEALKPAFYLEGRELYITTSIGIALYPDDGEDAQTLLINADAALYQAKERGRNNYQMYAPTMNSQTSELLALENYLHHALSREELVLYYQPQVNIKTGKINCMEALIRWQHPQLGLMLPEQFVPLAEETGLIVSIGEWVLREACAQNQLWHQAGFTGLRVAVNLSARQFQQPNLADTIGRILTETGLEARSLELEITETTIMQDVEFTNTMLGNLQEMGINISMDDFGTGYSSLSNLKKFPLRALKIDRSFVLELAVDPRDTAILSAAIALGHGLNLRVVAEGVETPEQLEKLRHLHCDEMQGYLCSPPLPAAETLAFLWERVAIANGKIIGISDFNSATA